MRTVNRLSERLDTDDLYTGLRHAEEMLPFIRDGEQRRLSLVDRVNLPRTGARSVRGNHRLTNQESAERIWAELSGACNRTSIGARQ